MNVSVVVLICVTSFVVLSLADDAKPAQKRILKLKNVNYNKTATKPRTAKKSQKNKTIFVLSNPVIYPQKLFSPKPTENVIVKPTNQFDFLNFDAYILKPRSINYTALLSHSNDNVQEKEVNKSPEPTTNYPQNEFIDFPRAEALIQTTVPAFTEAITFETTTQKVKKSAIKHGTKTPNLNSLFPLGLAYFDSLNKYRKAFDTLRKKDGTKKSRTKTKLSSTTTTTTTTTTQPPPTTTTTEEPYTEFVTTREYAYVATPNFDEDLYEEPHFESYRYQPRYHHNYEDETERNRYETTTRYLDYDTLDRDNNNHYESTESTETFTTTSKPPNSARRRPRSKNLHSSSVKSNYLYDRYTNYPQESRRVVSVARPDNYKDRRNDRHKAQAFARQGSGERGDTRRTETSDGSEKKHKNIVPMQRHYFQYANAINDGAYNAGVGKGNQNHYIEQHELSVPKNGTFQKRVRWNDKKGGFGELYYDLNHH